MGTLFLLLPIVLLLVLMSRGRKQQRRVSDLQATLAPGQRVVTTAGLHARVVEVGDSTVVLEPAEGVRTTWARQAVVRRLEDDAIGTGSVSQDDQAAPGPAHGTTSLLKHPTGPAGATAADPGAPERPQR